MRAGTLAAILLATCLVSPSQARLWKPTAIQLAGDYVAIIHNKGAEGRVAVNWVASPAISGAVLQQAMDKYVLISIAHTRVAPGGVTSWDDVQGVQVTDGANQSLKEVTGDAIPPTLVGFIASADALARQATQGRSKVHWGVYEAGNVNACQPGALRVSYDGETYSFDTPIPGCEKK